jgi:predicted PurR-regulated permease PerM
MKGVIMDSENRGGFFGMVREAFSILGKYFTGRLLISLILGVVCYIVLWILGIRLRLLISIIVALLNLVPYLGPIIAMAASALIVVFQKPIDALWVTVMNFTLQLVDALVLSPLILGRSLKVPGFVIVIAILVGGGLLGIWGIIFAVPVAAIILMIIRRIRSRRSDN